MGIPNSLRPSRKKTWRELASFSPRERALCTIAEKLSATPTRMVERDWQPLRDLGFDDLACLEVAHVVGIFNYLTRLADGFGVQLDQNKVRAAETGIPLKSPSSLKMAGAPAT